MSDISSFEGINFNLSFIFTKSILSFMPCGWHHLVHRTYEGMSNMMQIMKSLYIFKFFILYIEDERRKRILDKHVRKIY